MKNEELRMRNSLFILLVALFAFCASSWAGTFSEGGPEGGQTNRKKVGLVLGGGGAMGAAEVGVLKVIEEVGLPIDYIAGTSIGSIIGGLYAVGYRSAQLDTLFRTQEWLSLLTDRDESLKNNPFEEKDGTYYVFGFPISSSKNKKKTDEPGKFGALKGDKITDYLHRWLVNSPSGYFRSSSTLASDSALHVSDSTNFSRLPIPFRCVAFDMKKMKEVVFTHGSISTCMRASMAIPGAFKPVRMGDQMLFDGGCINNLPVDVVKDMGADIVIAIDLNQTQHENRDISLEEMFGITGILDWLVSRPDWKRYNANREAADLLINPPLEGYDVLSFSKTKVAEMLKIGESTGRKFRSQLITIKNNL